VLSLDALQYAPNKHLSFGEVARILKPGGRLAFTAFEVAPDRVSDLPVLEVSLTLERRPSLRRVLAIASRTL
jgi:ubiquinone/menaquinone biosynthesis C-methylase UbiE